MPTRNTKKRRLSAMGDCQLEEASSSSSENQPPQPLGSPRRPVRRSSMRRSIGRRSSLHTEATIYQIYHDCVQMGTKNKINQNNAWAAKLVDVMDKVRLVSANEAERAPRRPAHPDTSRTDSEGRPNFQVASHTLDASVRIWSCRVDSVHHIAFRMLSGLNRHSDKDGPPAGEGDGSSEGAAAAPGRSRKRNATQEQTLERNAGALNTKRLEMELAVDPLFHKTAAAFDEGGARGLLLSQLGVSYGGNVVFDSSEYHPEQMAHTPETYDSALLASLVPPTAWPDAQICPEFAGFSWASHQDGADGELLPGLDGEGEASDDDDESYGDYSHSLDLLSQRFPEEPLGSGASPLDEAEALVSQVDHLSLEAPAPYVEEEGPLASEPAPYDEWQDAPSPADDRITSLFEATHAIPSVDLIKNLVDSATDFHYFKNSLLNNWAGPEHWKFKPTKNQALKNTHENAPDGSPVKKKRASRKEFLIDFFEEDPTDYEALLAPSKRGGTISKESLLNSSKPTTLPFVDIQYELVRFTRLFSKPNQTIVFQSKAGSSYEEGVGPLLQLQGCDSGSASGSATGWGGADPLAPSWDEPDDEDVGGFAPTWGEEGLGEGGSWGAGEDASPSPFSSQITSHMVEAPDSVENIQISYARRAKRVDIDQLKGSIWKELCSRQEDKENASPNPATNEDDEVTETKRFSSVLSSLPQSVPSSQMSDLSVPLCFICLLDLANKKGLQIDQSGNDLSISKYIRT